MARTYRIGTRTSPLALRQVNEVLTALDRAGVILKVKITGMDTRGDKDKDTPISDVEESDFFTREIDDALLKGEIDFAVHSAKDLPETLREDLSIAAITSPVDPCDVLVSKSGLGLDKLPSGAKIGTSSLRRKEQLKEYRSDFVIVDLRGNIEERLRKLESSDLDAIVIAAAGLIRLDLKDRITERIPQNIVRTHPLQGALAVVTRTKDAELLALLSKIDSQEMVLK